MKDDFMSFASGQISDTLGVNTYVKIKRKRNEEKYKQKFIQTIYLLEECLNKSIGLGQFGVDLLNYESTFWEVIDNMLFLLFKDDNLVDVVSFYMYERLDQEGGINPYIDEELNDEYILESPEDLWDLIAQKLEHRKNGK